MDLDPKAVQSTQMVTKQSPSCGHEDSGHHSTETETDMPTVANACLLLVGMAGTALLVWWSLHFHPSNRQLWMVPAGLVMVGTPAIVWLTLFASDAWRRLELFLRPPPSDQPTGPEASDLEK